MKHTLAIALVLLSALASCSRNDGQIARIVFPEPPIEILSNEDVGLDLINYFNILPLPEGRYRMYFSGYKEEECGSDWDRQNLYYAESEDGIHYEFKGKLMDYVVEQSVFLTGENERPYGLVGRTPENGKLTMFLWKSKDGIEFGDKETLLIRWHDTQNVMVPRNGRLKLYTRVWGDGWVNRKNAVAEFSMDGERLTDIQPLAGDFLYNSAACPIDDRYDVLFPTYFNNKQPAGNSDTCFFKCYVVDGTYAQETPCNLNQWIEPDEKWVLAAPGFINIGGERYLAYNTRNSSHDTPPSKGIVSKYKLIKAVIRYDEGTNDKTTTVERIWDQGYSAFPSIVRYKDAIYVSFREGVSHVFDENGIAAGKTRILRSSDAKHWESVALLSKEGYDFRDPKLSVTPDGRLMVIQGGSMYVDKELVKTVPHVSFSSDGKTFSDPMPVDYDNPGRYAWFWRVTWFEGTGYTVSYGKSEDGCLELFKTSDGLHYEKITDIELDGSPNETTVRFLPDGNMVLLIRREGGDRKAYLGMSEPPYTEWDLQPLAFQIGGPDLMLLPDGALVAGGRCYFDDGKAKTCLWKQDADGTFEFWKTLPSGGDNSYPGFLVEDGTLFVVYYSSHELTFSDGKARAGIYLARVPLPNRP